MTAQAERLIRLKRAEVKVVGPRWLQPRRHAKEQDFAQVLSMIGQLRGYGRYVG